MFSLTTVDALNCRFMNSPKFATIAAAAAVASSGGMSIENKTDTEDTDSQLSAHSYSNNSSPPTAHAPLELSGHRADSPPEDWNSKQKKTSQQITKQIVQETLMDEGLRVIKELANQIRGCADPTETDVGLPPVATLGSSPSPMMPLSLTCGNKAEGAGTGRPRGRPPRLDRGDFVGTSRTISGSSSATPPPTQATTPTSASPLNMSRGNSNSPNPTLTDHSSNDKPTNLVALSAASNTNLTSSSSSSSAGAAGAANSGSNESNINNSSSNGHHKVNGEHCFDNA